MKRVVEGIFRERQKKEKKKKGCLGKKRKGGLSLSAEVMDWYKLMLIHFV
jgi:hypothetical protein